MDLSLRAVRYFVMVAEEGSFSAAASRLHTSQPSVSMTVKQLETQLGQKLMVRMPSRGVVLTAAGEALLPRARALLGRAQELTVAAGLRETELVGSLRCACFVNLAPAYLAGFLAEFRRWYPGIDVYFKEVDHEQILAGLNNGTYEIAIGFDLGGTEKLDVTKLATLPPYAVLGAHHPLASAPSVSLEDLYLSPLILMDLPHTRDYFLSLFARLDLTPNLSHLVTSLEMLRALAANNHGYGLMNIRPSSSTTYDGMSVNMVPLTEDLPPLDIVLLKLRDRPHRKITEVFYSLAIRYFTNSSVP